MGKKKIMQSVLVLAFLFQFSLSAESQVLRRAANRLGQKVIEKKVDREIEKKTDEIADSIVNAMEKDKRSPEEKAQAQENRRKVGGMLGRMMGGINQAELPATYNFDQRMVMEMEDERGNVSEMTVYYSDGSPAVGYEFETDDSKDVAFVVMNFEEEYVATFTVSDGEKSVMSIPLPMDEILDWAEEAENSSDDDYSIRKTGKSKTINGYHCEEYVTESDNVVQHMWVTQDVKMTSYYFALLKNMSKNNKRMGKMPEEWPQGVPIEIEIVDQKKNRKSYVRTKEFGSVQFAFPASEYSYMSIGN